MSNRRTRKYREDVISTYRRWTGESFFFLSSSGSRCLCRPRFYWLIHSTMWIRSYQSIDRCTTHLLFRVPIRFDLKETCISPRNCWNSTNNNGLNLKKIDSDFNSYPQYYQINYIKFIFNSMEISQ